MGGSTVVTFKKVPLTDLRLTAEKKKSFLQVGQLFQWDYSDASGKYSGLVIVGEKSIPQGFQTMSDLTVETAPEGTPMTQVEAVLRNVAAQLQQQSAVALFK
jgi:hypothetical protein